MSYYDLMRSDWPLAGREDELRRLCDRIVTANDSVVLAGDTGVGKSRLAAELMDRWRATGAEAARVSATRAGSEIPLGAFAGLLPGNGPGTAGDDAEDRAQLLRRCVTAIENQASGAPFLLFVDDAHLLDPMSALLVQQLSDTAVVLIVTVRSGEPAPDPVQSLWKDRRIERIELGCLDSDAACEALTAALGTAVDEDAVTQLMARSNGNMLFLRELVEGALHDGTFRDVGGIWRLVGALHPSERLVELVESRMEDLTPDERSLMEVVAFGEPLGPSELGWLSSETVAERLERRGLLRCRTEGLRLHVALGHPVYGEVLRARVPALRARSIARALAESVEATGARRKEDLLRIASWRLIGGGATADQMMEAATTARRRYDYRLAERFARTAHDLGAGFEAAVLVAQLASLQGRTAEADDRLEELAREAEEATERAVVALSRLDNRVIYSGAIEQGIRIADQATALLPQSELRDEIFARRSALLLATEGPRSAVECVTPLLERTRGRALVWACMPGAYSLARTGRITEALEVVRRGREEHLSLTSPIDWYPWMHAFYECDALVHGGRYIEAESLANRHYLEGIERGSVEEQATFAWQLAKSVAERGNVDEAIQHTRKAVSIFRQLDRAQFVEFCLIYQALAYAVGGRADEAAEALAEIERLETTPTYFMGVDLWLARAWLSVAEGHLRQGRDLLLAAVETAERIGDLTGQASALHTVARIGYPKEVVEPLAAVSAGMEGVFAGLRVTHVRALADDVPDELERVSEGFEEVGAILLAAEASADAAVARRRCNDSRRSAAAAQRADWLAGRAAGADTPALRAMGTRAVLTPAEWETAQLAAGGHTNRSIASEFVISVRTVENRLQVVYEKLGVKGRSELADALATVTRPGAGGRRHVMPSVAARPRPRTLEARRTSFAVAERAGSRRAGR